MEMSDRERMAMALDLRTVTMHANDSSTRNKTKALLRAAYVEYGLRAHQYWREKEIARVHVKEEEAQIAVKKSPEKQDSDHSGWSEDESIDDVEVIAAPSDENLEQERKEKLEKEFKKVFKN